MAINLNLKIILKTLIITFLIVKDSLASTISGYEIKSLIEKWLEKLRPYGLDVMFKTGFDHTSYTNDTQKKILQQYQKITAPLL